MTPKPKPPWSGFSIGQLVRVEIERSVVGVTQYVSDHVVGCWGSGESLDDAIEDYEHNLLEAYEDLIAAGENLSRLAQERLDLLRSFLDLPR